MVDAGDLKSPGVLPREGLFPPRAPGKSRGYTNSVYSRNNSRSISVPLIEEADGSVKLIGMGRLIILSGPSCIGKSPLCSGLRKFHPKIGKSLQRLVLYNSLAARPKEVDGVDYFFRTREEIKDLQGRKDFMVMEVRGDLQALDLKAMRKLLAAGEVRFEGNALMAKALIDTHELRKIKKLLIFLSPL